MDSQPWPPEDRQHEIDTRLEAIRARLKTLRERDTAWDAVKRGTVAPSDRVAAAARYAAEAHATATEVLAASVRAFRRAAEAHDRAADAHEKAAAARVGDVRWHEQQEAHHHAAAAADRQRADRAQSLLPGPKSPGPAAVSDEPGARTAR